MIGMLCKHLAVVQYIPLHCCHVGAARPVRLEQYKLEHLYNASWLKRRCVYKVMSRQIMQSATMLNNCDTGEHATVGTSRKNVHKVCVPKVS